MSNLYYHELWITTQEEVITLLKLDNLIQEDKIPKSRQTALQIIFPIYYRYRKIVGQLISCCDHIVHSQKRKIVKLLLDYSIGRMLEYKREIVKLNCSEYESNLWPDDLLIQMKWTPDDISLSSPISHVTDRQEELEKRRRQIDNLFAEVNARSDLSRVIVRFPRGNSQAETLGGEQEIQEAIVLIQTHERARIGHAMAKKAQYESDYNLKLKLGELKPQKIDIETLQRAANTIQRHWRGYSVRSGIKKHWHQLENILGMAIPSWKDETAIKKDLENLKRRQLLQPIASMQVEAKTTEEITKIYKKRSPVLKEEISDEIREWFDIYYKELGHFGIFPSIKDGGSVAIMTGKTPSPEEYSELNKKSEKKLTKEKNQTQKKERKKSTFEGWVMPRSKVIECLNKIANEFQTNWGLKNMFNNKTESREYLDLIREDIYYELQLKIRKDVDYTMRFELDQLNKALKKDHKKDKKKFNIPGLKKARKQNRRNRKKKNTKPNQVPDKELLQMFQELVSAKIIRNYREIGLDQWLGDTSYQKDFTKSTKNMKHRLGDIKQPILDYCILPMISRNAHAAAPLIKSVCIVGTPQGGKTFLADAICHDLGALLFDLTPNTLAGQYDGKSNEKKLLKMIGILARQYPPAIVLIDGGDKPWWKKLPSEEKLNKPKRLVKLLSKFIKSIKPGDQILVLGLAEEPWRSSKQLYRFYSKFIIIPPTDYASLYLVYQHFFMSYHGIPRNINISSLAKVSIGYPLNIVCQAIENVLNVQRRIQLKIKPLQLEEIHEELLKWEGPKPQILKKFLKFENRTPLGRKKAKL